MSNIISLSGGTNLTKELMQAKALHLTQDVRSGKMDALVAYTQIRFMEESLRIALDLLKEQAMDEAAKYPKGDRKLQGVGFELRDAQERIDYEADPEYCRLKSALKDREALLKQATKGKGETLDPVSGEVVAKMPIKYSGPTLAITFPK